MSKQLLSAAIAAVVVLAIVPNGHALNLVRRRSGGSADPTPVHRSIDDDADNIITKNHKLRQSLNDTAKDAADYQNDTANNATEDVIDQESDESENDESDKDEEDPEDVLKEHVEDPCFVSNSGKVMCLPHFMYVGLGHAGSTSLGTWLAKHPDVVWNIKADQSEGNQGNETRYWAKCDGTAKEGPFDREEFADFFPVITPGSNTKIGAKDPSITAAGEALSKPMLDMMPWLKIIVFLREPVEHWISRNYYTQPDVQDWVMDHVAGREKPFCKDFRFGLNMTSMSEFAESFESRNVFVALTEELDTQPEDVLQRLETFLGLSHIDWSPILAEGREHVNPETFQMTVKQRCAMDLCVRPVVQEMDDFARRYNQDSTFYLPEERSHWEEVGALHKSPSVDGERCQTAFEQLNYTGSTEGTELFDLAYTGMI